MRESEGKDSSEESTENENLSENEIELNNPISPCGCRITCGNSHICGQNGTRGQAQRCPRANNDEEIAWLELQWSETDRNVFYDCTAQLGLQVQLPNNTGLIDYFMILFLTDEFFNLLVEQINQYTA